ncbi:hypothetical protein FIBSPDRAFT_1056149 [Athelia psychrophila]|uniref:Uncharacterized protein n=1 Tax=Athelia psychrophila TaxID=1759441 RepID=A0A167SLC5_9AGAM|nr:hypothetical protein FIBSPDRAFT_1056149 [Fibularhizoctonia sp. CBS 109695]
MDFPAAAIAVALLTSLAVAGTVLRGLHKSISHRPQQTHSAHEYSHGPLVLSALTSGDCIFATLGSQIGAAILGIAYGIKALPGDDPVPNLAGE